MKSETVSGSHNTHARLSPSSSKTWSTCTASLAFIEANSHRIPKDTSSIYSNEGTEAHEWAANVLLNKITRDDVPDNFRPYVDAYVNHCLDLVPEGVSYQVEVQCPLFYQPSSTGTCDFAIITDSRVTVRDLKYGAGVLVTADDNSQLAIYSLSLIRMLEDVYAFTDDTIVDIGIFQPRHREAQDATPWIITLKELIDFCDHIESSAMVAFGGVTAVQAKLPCGQRDISAEEVLKAAPGTQFVPQEGDDGSCRWCKSKGFCEVRLAAATEGFTLPGISGVDMIALLPDLSKDDAKLPVEERVELAVCEVVPNEVAGTAMLSDSYLVCIHERSKAIKKFLDDVEELLEARALAGNPVPGTKLVEGRAGNRAWANEEEADTFLRGKKLKESERYNFKLKSPTEMEKVLDIKNQPKRTQTRWNELVTRAPGKPVLVLESDKRPAISAAIEALPDLGGEFEV